MTIEREKYNQYISALGVATKVMTSVIKKVIIIKDAIDTHVMKNTMKAKIILDPKSKRPKYIELNFNPRKNVYYYRFVDTGTRKITPRRMTRMMRDHPDFQTQMQRVMTAYLEWQTYKELQ